MTIELDFGQPQISAEQEKWQARAVLMAESQQMDITLVRNSGSYQLWPSSKVNGGIYTAKYSDNTSDKDGAKND